MNKEIWVRIPGYEDYSVSSIGNVIRNSNSYKNKPDKKMKLHNKDGGYIGVSIGLNGSRKTFRVHRLMMLAFHGPSDKTVNHINGIRTDNRLENLEYVSQRENNNHSIKKTRLTGAYRHRNGKNFFSRIYINNKPIYLGAFDNEIDAHNAYLLKAKEIGELKYMKTVRP